MKTAFIFLSTSAILSNASQFNSTYHGDATYYGESQGGNCVLRNPVPEMYAGRIPMALNGPQYGNSEMCGACIRGTGNGVGSGHSPVTGTFDAYVSDQCPGCAHGDLDFAMSGDGRWEISWEFVPCEGGGEPTFKFEGSNPWYWKVQPRGMPSPAQKVIIYGQEAMRTQDNFFVATSSSGFPEWVTVEVITTLGQKFVSEVSLP